MLSESINSTILFDVVQTEALLASHVRRRGVLRRTVLRGGTHLWRLPTRLRQSVCLWPGATSARRGVGLAVRGKGAVSMAKRLGGDDGEEPERHVVEQCTQTRAGSSSEICSVVREARL